MMRFGISCIISILRCVMIILVPIKSLFTKYLHGCHVVTFLYLHGCHVVTFLFNLALCSSRFWTYAVRVTLLNIINSFTLFLFFFFSLFSFVFAQFLHPDQSFPLSLCGPISICRANAHKVYGLKHQHFTSHSITTIHS